MVLALNEAHGNRFTVYNGDCVDVIRQLPDNCVDFSIYSPPFGNLFVYSDSAADMGNSTDEEFARHYSYLVKEKLRVTKPGRLTAVHCSDLPMTKWRDGAVGIKDFSGDIIRIHQEAGWIMHSRRTIWKCPVTEMTRTKHVGLLFKQLMKDSAKSRGGMPDYLITFVKPGENGSPIWHPPVPDFTTRPMPPPQIQVQIEHLPPEEWSDDARQWAEKIDAYGKSESEALERWLAGNNQAITLPMWQEWASPIWVSIDQSNTLNVRMAKEGSDERHLCPLQLDVIERAVIMWSNPGDVVMSPFTGIGSEGVGALKLGRKFVGTELKTAYWKQAVQYLEAADRQGDLFGEAVR